jgi:hypothetical protein
VELLCQPATRGADWSQRVGGVAGTMSPPQAHRGRRVVRGVHPSHTALLGFGRLQSPVLPWTGVQWGRCCQGGGSC